MGDADGDETAKAAAALEECVALLSSDSREKKFVGMLLVTRLLPDGDDDLVLTRVYGATGFHAFVTSMLRAAPSPVEAAESPGGDDTPGAGDGDPDGRAAQATASHSLALATCAALSKAPAVATDVSMVERLSLFGSAMARKGRYASLPSSAVADACEAATRVVAAGGESAAGKAAESGVLAAAAVAIENAAAEMAPTETEKAKDADPDRNLPLLGAMRLLAMLLESPNAMRGVCGHGSESDDGGGHGVTLATGERELGDAESGRKKNSDEKSADDKKHAKTAKAAARALPALAKTFACSPGQPTQIEALRCVSLLLSALPARAPFGKLTATLAKAARPKRLGNLGNAKSGTDKEELTPTEITLMPNWLHDLRGGVSSVLRAKAPRELRHVALDLCAAACDLVGPSWLCFDLLSGAAEGLTETKTKGKNSVSFFRLVLELTRVETAVLLHDLTRDDREVRQNARRMLHVPLVVYERLVSALAQDCEAGEAFDLNEGSDGQSESKSGSLLSPETAAAAVGALADVAEKLLEFLELLSSGDDSQKEKENPHGIEPALDAGVFLATIRALSAFLAELPEPHARRVNALLPSLFAENTSENNSRALSPSPNARALVIRFLLPYVLQATETPEGLDAFAAANGPGACAFLLERVVASGDEKNQLDKLEACGVIAAAVAALRNGADGSVKGLVGETLGERCGEVFWRTLPSLVVWAVSVTGGFKKKQGDDDDGVLAVVFRFAGLAKSETKREKKTWRDALATMEFLVPGGCDLGEGGSVGGGGFLGQGTEGGVDGNAARGFDEPIEL